MRFAYTKPDGGVSIVIAAPKVDLELVLGELTDEQYRTHVTERSIPKDATNVTELPDDWQAPDDRTFRNAWAFDGKAVSVNMDKARDIHRDRLRALRMPMLEVLDIDYQIADEAENATLKQQIAAQKQALRDVTNDSAIENAKTPEELAAVLPAALRSQG